MSCALWGELMDVNAKNWFLLFLHMKLKVDRKTHCGLAIKLFHRCFVAWKGNKGHHNSTVFQESKQNHVFSVFFGLKDFMKEKQN